MQKRTPFLVAIVVFVLALGAVVTPAGALTAPYFAPNLPENGIFGQMVDQPQAVHHGNVTYVAYQGPGLDPYIAAYHWDTKTWEGPVKAAVNAQTTDAHGSPSIFVDVNDYVHIFYGPHREPLSHAMSKVPNSISGGWTTMPKIGTDVTYPQVVRVGDRVMLFYRGASDIWESVESADGVTWNNRRQFTGAYYPSSFYCSFREGPDHDSVLVAMVRMEWNEYFAKTSFGRHDVFFAQLKADDLSTYTWRNAQDDTITVPVTQATAKDQALVENTGSDTANIPVPGFEGTGTIGVLFNRGSGVGLDKYSYRFARANASSDPTSWTVTTVAKTDHFYDAATWRAEKTGPTTQTVVYAEYKGTTGQSLTPFDYTDIGGEIHRFVWNDGSTSWIDEQRIDPGVEGSLLGKGLYHNPHLVTDGEAGDRVIYQELCPDVSIEAFGGYLWGDKTVNGWGTGNIGRVYKPAVQRIAAPDRYSEAAAIAKKAFPQGTDTVVIASGEVFADALVAAPLAKALNAPILLVKHDSLPSATTSAINYLGASKALVIGGKTTVQDNVYKAVLATRISKIERLAAANRYDTAALVAQRLWALKGAPRTAYIANGEKFADGLSVGSVAAARGEPVLLVRPDFVPISVTDTLEMVGAQKVVVVGGPASVSEAVAGSLGASKRLGGATRYEVADGVAAYGLANGLSPRRVAVVTGQVYPDCLTAAVLASRLNGVTLLTTSATLSPGANAHLKANAPQNLDVLVCGGTSSVSATTYSQIQAASTIP